MEPEQVLRLVALSSSTDITDKLISALAPEEDIWNTRFAVDFPDHPYYDWWTPKENYLLQKNCKKYGGMVLYYFADSVAFEVIHLLCKPKEVYNVFCEDHNKLIRKNTGFGLPSYLPLKLDFAASQKRYLVLIDDLNRDWEEFTMKQFDTQEEIDQALSKEKSYVIDLSLMGFDFSPCEKREVFRRVYKDNNNWGVKLVK
jgi:hypothetical protein